MELSFIIALQLVVVTTIPYIVFSVLLLLMTKALLRYSCRAAVDALEDEMELASATSTDHCYGSRRPLAANFCAVTGHSVELFIDVHTTRVICLAAVRAMSSGHVAGNKATIGHCLAS